LKFGCVSLSMSKPIYEQLPGEHIQAFTWRVHQSMIENWGEDVPEQKLFNRVFLELHPRVTQHLPTPVPSNLHKLLCFADVLADLIPSDDPFWHLAESTRYKSPTMIISVDNEYASFIPSNPKDCFKCGVKGHFANQCPNPRNRSIRPKRNRKKPRKPEVSVSARGYVRARPSSAVCK